MQLLLPRIYFGAGCCRHLAGTLKGQDVHRPLLVTDRGVRNSGTLDKVLAHLSGFNVVIFADVTEPPCFSAVDAAAIAYRRGRCDGVIAVGGGSVIDTAKMLTILATHDGGVEQFAGHGDRIVRGVAPLVVLPTTAGSGSEVSPSTGIHPLPGQPALRTRADALVPRAALCDPDLTATMPPRVTANTGLDALTHCIEGYLSPMDNPFIDVIALEGIPRLMAHLPHAVADGQNREARSAVMMGALAGGIAIGKGLGPAHAMATAFSHWPVPHGVLAVLSLPPVLDLLQRNAHHKLEALASAMQLPAGMSPGDGLRALLQQLHAHVPLTLRAAGCELRNARELRRLADDCAASPVNHSSAHAPDTTEYRHLIEAALG